MRWLAWTMAGLVALLLALGTATWFLLDRVDLAGFASRRATAAAGRPVGIGSLHVTPGRWLRVELRNATLANAEGGTRPDMARLAAATAELDAWPLLHGTIVLRNVRLDGMDVLLERIEGRGPNWHFEPRQPAPPPTDADPARRGTFPLLTELRVKGQVTVRSSSGTNLPITLDDVAFTAPSLDAPTTLAGPATYKGIPIRLEAALGSIAQYRNAAQPFPTRLHLVSGTPKLAFDGTMTDPLNLDGAHGKLTLEAPTPETLLRLAGADPSPGPALALSGQLDHAGPMWQLSRAQGTLAKDKVLDATIRLEEGIRPSDTAPAPPDRVGLAVQFDRLDIDALTAHEGRSGGADPSLRVDPAPKTLLAARILARSARYNGVTLTDLHAEGSQTQGEVKIDTLSLTYLGGKVEASGTVTDADGAGRVEANVRVAGMEVQALRGVLGMGRLPLSGRLSGQAVVAATGESLNRALPTARASAVLTMSGGTVSREVVQLGSTDLRALFGKAEGTVPVACLLGVLDVRGGVGTLTPIRLRTAEGTIAAHGTVDLTRHQLNLVVESESRTTGLLALDIPVQVYGSFSKPSFAPAQLSAAGRAQAAAGDEIGRLLPALQPAARASPCLGRRQ